MLKLSSNLKMQLKLNFEFKITFRLILDENIYTACCTSIRMQTLESLQLIHKSTHYTHLDGMIDISIENIMAKSLF